MALLYDYSQETTFHGFSYLTRATRFQIRRVVWGALILTAVAVFIYYAEDRITEYFKYPTNVNVELRYIDHLAFPAITICNQNNFRLTAAVQGGWYKDIEPLLPASSTASIKPTCSSSQYECANGQCIDITAKCDMFPDCEDGSDENNCDKCPRIFVRGNTLPHQIKEKYFVKKGEYNKRPYYNQFAYDGETAFLYYDPILTVWIFGKSMPTEEPEDTLVKSDSASNIDDVTKYTGHWFFDDQLTPLSIECKPFSFTPADMDLLATEKIDDINLEKVYKNGSHKLEDFLGACQWKGEPCGIEDFTEQYTDLGVCYKFTPSQDIQKAGPGYGLKVELNIEQYDYTKNPTDGVGVQILLHDSSDYPLMSEKSIAISPGLYSLVAVERTEITNLEDPWGNCTAEAPKYYNVYTTSTCRLSCENRIVREKCRCRLLHMAGEDLRYCDIGEVYNCTKGLAAKVTNECATCTEPCTEIFYVPSISFSAISNNEDTLNAEESERMKRLQEKLTAAREITYRISNEKYRGTMKIFSKVRHEFENVYTTILAVGEYLKRELSDVRYIAASVNTDCIASTKRQFDIVSKLRSELLVAAERNYNYMYTDLYVNLRKLSDITAADVDAMDQLPEYDHWGRLGLQTRKNDTLFVVYSPLVRSIDIALTRYDQLVHVVDNFGPNLTYNLFYNDRVGTLMQYLRSPCTWCLSQDDSLVFLVKTKLNSFLVPFQRDLTSVKSELEAIHPEKLENAEYLTWDVDDIQDGNRTAFIQRVKAIADDFEQALNSFKNNMQDNIILAADMVEDILRLTSPKCGTELQKLYDEYVDIHTRSNISAVETQAYIGKSKETFLSYEQDYIDTKSTLTNMTKHLEITNIITYMQAQTNVIDSLLKNRKIALERMEEHINILYYWLTANTRDSYSIDHSKFLKNFGIETIELRKNSPKEGDIIKLDLDYGLENEKVRLFWGNKTEHIDSRRSSLESTTLQFTNDLNNVLYYLNDFLEGNKITTEFYKKNSLTMDIFYKELSERIVEQEKAYELPQLMGEVGGLMGLLIGASVMTLFEFADLLLYNLFDKVIMPIKPVGPGAGKEENKKNDSDSDLSDSSDEEGNDNKGYEL